MARHRNIRSMNYDEEFDDFDQVGSVNDEPDLVSPTDASQWMFDRARGQSSLNAFLSKNEDIQELDEDDGIFDSRERRDSEHFVLPELNDLDKGKLMSCMEEIRNIIGDSCSDKRIVKVIMANDFDFTKSLDVILNEPEKKMPAKPKPTGLIEKDSRDMFSVSDEPKFQSLSDLGKYHLGKINMPSGSKFQLPTLGSGGGFKLPKLDNIPAEISSCSEVQNNLSTFANMQLKNYQQNQGETSKKSAFIIPKLFPAANVPLPIDKMETLMISEEKTDSQKIMIDLKEALLPVSEQQPLPMMSERETKPDVEYFVPQFVDCDHIMDTATKDPLQDVCYEQISLKDLKKRYKKYPLKKFSIIGMIISKKFRKKVPKIVHAYETNPAIVRFKFDTPSPDDQILQHLNKIKK